ncbi:hypothetical protein T484DRAFT_1935124 [Baffinella frigidus]|nr:hypothetical protein T484DRAFT_1935124 [Cryptophyta sp. CCMP2293]
MYLALSRGLEPRCRPQTKRVKARARLIPRESQVIQPLIHPRDRFTDYSGDFSLLCFQPVAVHLALSPKYT